MSIIMFKFVSQILKGVKGFILNFPTGTPNFNNLNNIFYTKRNISYKIKGNSFTCFVIDLFADVFALWLWLARLAL